MKTITPFTLMSDSLSLFDVLRKGNCTTEKSLIAGLQTLKDAYQRFEVSNVPLVRCGQNISDAVRKAKFHSDSLRTLSSNVWFHQIEH